MEQACIPPSQSVSSGPTPIDSEVTSVGTLHSAPQVPLTLAAKELLQIPLCECNSPPPRLIDVIGAADYASTAIERAALADTAYTDFGGQYCKVYQRKCLFTRMDLAERALERRIRESSCVCEIFVLSRQGGQGLGRGREACLALTPGLSFLSGALRDYFWYE